MKKHSGMSKSKSKKCLLCNESACPTTVEEEYLEGFCEACIISMKKDAERKPPRDQSSYQIIEKITLQIENIEDILSKFLPNKKDRSSTSTTGDPTLKLKIEDADATVKLTIDKNQSNINKTPSSISEDKPVSKPKSKSKKKFMPTITKTVD